jgi:hypothetical protein
MIVAVILIQLSVSGTFVEEQAMWHAMMALERLWSRRLDDSLMKAKPCQSDLVEALYDMNG